MQLSKKLFTATITALLLVSAFATILPAALAAPTATLSASSGNVGASITVAGTGAQPGAFVNVYWENMGGLLLATGFADGLGAYNLTLRIPDSTAGTKYIIVQDPTGTVSVPFTVTASITRSPTTGIPGDQVNITGSGFSGTVVQRNVTITFWNATYSIPVGAVNATSTGNFSVLITVPNVLYGSYSITATDQAPTPNTATVSFTVGATIAISPTSGPSGTLVTVTGRGFSSVLGTNVSVSVGGTPAVQPTQIRTLADGTFSGTIIVPTLAVSATRYTVTATDGTFSASTSGTGSFLVTGTTGLTVTPTSAQPGASVTLTGRNFTRIAGTTVTIRFGATPAGTMELTTFTTDSTGGFSGVVTVPTLPTGPGYYFNATDSNRLNASTTFSIAITALFLSPTSGATGSVVTLTGFGLGTTGGTTFNVTIDGTLLTPTSNTIASLSAGTTTISIPTISTGAKTVVVTDNLGLSASATFTVTATSTLLVNPTTGPATMDAALTLTNFRAGVTVAFYIRNSTYSAPLSVTPGPGFLLLVTNSSGTLTGIFTIPSLSLGSYSIVANETSGQWNATAAFTIGEPTFTIKTRALTYLQGDTLSFEAASSFSGSAIVNIYDPKGVPASTWVYMSELVGDLYIARYNYYGYWYALHGFLIPSDAPTGIWTWNATFLGLTRSGSFTVKASTGAIITAINDTVTEMNSRVIAINGSVVTLLTNVGTVQTTLNAINATVVAINGNVATLVTSVGTLTTTVNTINATVTSIRGDVATISTSVGVIRANVTTIMPTITTISSGVAAVQTSVGTVQTTLSAIQGTLSSVSGSVGTISTSIGSITSELSAINTKVTSISNGVATIQTDVGTIKGTVTSTDGKVATIQTAIGTLQADVSDVQASVETVPGQVNTPIYIAVVLALIAALASILCLVMMRRKIAG